MTRKELVQGSVLPKMLGSFSVQGQVELNIGKLAKTQKKSNIPVQIDTSNEN